MSRSLPTVTGRYGVRQFDTAKGEQSGGTVWMGWDTPEAAREANPDTDSWRFEVFDRWPYLPAGESLPWEPHNNRPVETVQTALDAA